MSIFSPPLPTPATPFSYDKDEYGLFKSMESHKIHVQVLIVSDYSFKYSHFEAVKSLHEWMAEEGRSGRGANGRRQLQLNPSPSPPLALQAFPAFTALTPAN